MGRIQVLGANGIDAGESLAAGIMNNSSTVGNPTAEKIAPYVLLGMTAVTGLVDAVSFLSLGRVFAANMTGNVLVVSGRGDSRRTNHGPSGRRLTDSIRSARIPA
jgi:uncharacterized protein DUF1275